MTRGGYPDASVRSLGEDPEAFETFYRAHVREVTRYVARRCRTPEDVADAVAATFLAVLTSARTFDPTLGSPRTWLYAIAANESARLARMERRRNDLQSRLQGRWLLTQDDIERVGEIIDAEREAARVERFLLEQASPSERDLVGRMVETGDLPANASRALGITPGAGRVRLTRLRRRIRHQLRADQNKARACDGEGEIS